MNRHNLEFWLEDMGLAVSGTDTQSGIPGYSGQAPQPGFENGVPMGQVGDTPPQQQPQQQPPQQQKMPDVANDPKSPDEVHEKEEKDFESWKREYMKNSSTASVDELKNAIMEVRDRDLSAYERKFVEDNLQILFLRENSNIALCCKDVRKRLRDSIDHNLPAVSLLNALVPTLEQQSMLRDVFIKIAGLRGMKGEYFREYVASLLGAVQLGSSSGTEDIVLVEKDYQIRLSARSISEWGSVLLGPWQLKIDDPERFLKPVELHDLESGAPDMRNALRRRLIIDSICEAFSTRAFLVESVDLSSGTVYLLGWDLSRSLKVAFTEGHLVVRMVLDADENACFIDTAGKAVQIPIIKILYVSKTGEMDANGGVLRKEEEFMEQRGGSLFLTASLETLKKALSVFQGMAMKTLPYNGNPSDIKNILRCNGGGVTSILLTSC